MQACASGFASSTYMLAGPTYIVAGSTYIIADSTYIVAGSTYIIADSTYIVADSTNIVADSTYMAVGSTYIHESLISMRYGSEYWDHSFPKWENIPPDFSIFQGVGSLLKPCLGPVFKQKVKAFMLVILNLPALE